MNKSPTKTKELFCTCCKNKHKESMGGGKPNRDQELTSPYGDNNPPLPMSSVKDKDYSC